MTAAAAPVLGSREAHVRRATPRSPRPDRRPVLLLLPAGVLIGLLLACSLAVLRLSFGARDAEWTGWSLDSYVALLDGHYLRIIFDTIWLALLSAVLTVVLSFPIALCMTRTTSELARRVILICVMLPMIVSLLVQSFGWMAIIGPDGLLNQVARVFTGQPRTFSLLFNRTGVLLGLIQTTVPLAVLPMAAALRTIPVAFEEAAGVLGANRLRVYRHIVLPLAWPGIAAGGILVFGFNTGAFVVPLLLGGLKVTTIAVVIRDQMGPLLNWPLGAALSTVLIALALGVQALNRVINRDGPGGAVR
jgi:putative spermidine/putrescine transport system permease protein